MKTRTLASVLALTFVALGGCADDPTGPSMDQVAGTYDLTQLIVRQGNAESDLIAGGVTTTITLNADGSTTGSLFIPASVNIDGVEIDADLTGTWALEGSNVRFTHEPDTFLTDVEWTYRDSGDLTVGDSGNWIEATLSGQ